MILPIYAYGQPVLKREAAEVEKGYPELEKLISDMWDTMYNAKGIGLAAPQVGRSVRLFIIDTEQLELEDEVGLKKVFLNAEVENENGPEWAYEEGCLSIPKLTGDVDRPETITLRYQDEDFKEITETFTGMNARVIQHEYDHIDGILFVEKLKPLKRRLISRKLDNIKKGKVDSSYKMKFKAIK